jgi:acylphosphatase
VKGFIRNLPDGRVEAFAQGSERSVEAFKQDLTAGPRFSQVSEVEETVLEPAKDFSTFRIER